MPYAVALGLAISAFVIADARYLTLYIGRTLAGKLFSMRLFNSFQAVGAFCAWPFLINWLATKPFPMSSAALVVACALYVIGFGSMVYCVFKATIK